MKRILILGAGGHGQVVADILLAIAKKTEEIIVSGFLDDNPKSRNQSFLGIPVLGSLQSLPSIPHDGVIVAIGENQTRARIAASLLARQEVLVSAVHPQAVIGTGVRIGAGSMICAGVVVNACTDIGEGVILNTGCTVDHHCVIGSYSHIAPGVHLGGEVIIAECALIGIGAIVLPHRRVGARAVVGGGAAVIDDVPADSRVVGVPARCIVPDLRHATDPS